MWSPFIDSSESFTGLFAARILTRLIKIELRWFWLLHYFRFYNFTMGRVLTSGR